MSKIFTFAQGTDEWLQARAGMITASRISDVIARAGTAARRNYQAELIVERLTGAPSPGGFVSAEMRWGTEQEPNARAAYELETGADLREVGFTVHEIKSWAGASPDALVGVDGAIEIKCPNTSNHLEAIETGKIKRQYWNQMQWVMFVNDLAWCDFVSYDPRVRVPGLQLYIQRVDRDQAWIDATVKEATIFNLEVDRRVDFFKSLAEKRSRT